jgi:hypothetical protein
MRLWFNDHEQERRVSTQNLENTITLSEAFYKEIDEHRIPAEREVIATLAHAPGLLDFYMWVVWKGRTVSSKPAYAVADWLRKVKALWPKCPARISDDGQFLVVESSRKCQAVNPM